MKRFSRSFRLAAAATGLFFLYACSSSTIIQSQPSGAKLYLNGEPVGSTPYTMTDTKMIGSITTVRLEAPGYETTTGAITRNEEFDVGACIGGFFLLVPFLWLFKYKPTHTFEMRPLGAAPGAPAPGWGAPPPAYGAPPPAYGAPPQYAPPPPPPGAYPQPQPQPQPPR
jgi:hypothetical protein